jgi:POT family proton-dependent oligopeptide transporter
MSSGRPALDIIDTTPVDPSATTRHHKDESLHEKQEASTSATERLVGPNGEQYPTDEDWATLRRVYGKVNWMIYIIGIVEMCERFAYYGTTAVCRYDHALKTTSADHTSR